MKFSYILFWLFGFLVTCAHCCDLERKRDFVLSDPAFHGWSVDLNITSIGTEKRWSELVSNERINFIMNHEAESDLKDKAIAIETTTRNLFLSKLRALGGDGILYYFVATKEKSVKTGYVRVKISLTEKLTRSDFYIFMEMEGK